MEEEEDQWQQQRARIARERAAANVLRAPSAIFGLQFRKTAPLTAPWIYLFALKLKV